MVGRHDIARLRYSQLLPCYFHMVRFKAMDDDGSLKLIVLLNKRYVADMSLLRLQKLAKVVPCMVYTLNTTVLYCQVVSRVFSGQWKTQSWGFFPVVSVLIALFQLRVSRVGS